MVAPPNLTAGPAPVEPSQTFIDSPAPRIRCVAGPGTGKTYSLKKRVTRLLGAGTVGARIFAVTFTRQAAAQLRADLTGLGVPGAETINASTLHAYAFKILGSEGAIQALGRTPRPLFKHEEAPFHHDMAAAHDGVTASKQKLHAFDAMWARLQSDDPGWPPTPADNMFHQSYLAWMRFHRSITLGELIPLAVQYLRNNPENDIVGSFEHVLVDEYQDLNRADQVLIELIGQQSNIAIVGDDDQSIYSFRHAHPQGIREWLHVQPAPKQDVELARCYRCDGRILDLANHLIRQNPGRLRGDLLPLPGREAVGEVRAVQWQTREQETKGLAKGIQKLLQNDRVPDGQKILVLVPRREFGRWLQEALTEEGNIDNKVYSKDDWADANVGESLTLIRLLSDESDFVALRYWLGMGHGQWRRNEYARLRTACEAEGVEPPAILSNSARCQQLKIAPLRERWLELQQQLQQLRALSEEALLDQLLPLAGTTRGIGESVRSLRDNGEEGTLADLLVASVVAPEDEPMDAKVNIMTYHGAKGLTAHTVICAGLVNGVMPRVVMPATPDDQAKLQEERRIFFVAITRAKHRLVLSSFRSVTTGENAQLKLGLTGNGFRLTTSASRFLHETGPSLPIALAGDRWLKAFDP